MEQENNEKTTSVFEKRVGNIERESNILTPTRIIIVGIKEKTEKSNGLKLKIPLVQIICKHPEKEEPIFISKIKTAIDEKVITKTLWEQLDEEENIQKGSAIDNLLEFTESDCLVDLEGKELDTIVESKDSQFLCLKLFN